MKLIEKATGKLVDVPDEQAAKAFSSGNYGVPKGQPVGVVGSDGTVGTVAPEHLQAVIEGGGRFASDQELHQATIHEKYGGLVGGAVAGVEGAARGLSVGLSDPLAIGAGRLFGGEKGEREVREHLAGEKEEHPWLSTGAEIGGAAVPMLLSGGAAAPAVGAMEEAGAIARIGEGVRTLGALPRGVGALGDFAEHAVSGVLGAPGSVIGRGAQAAAKMAARGVVEGGLFGAGQDVSQDALENQDLTGEKLYHAVGHSALTAGLLGGALGGVGRVVGEGASALLGKLSPKLDDAAGEQAWRWLNPRVKEARIAMRRAGGTDEVGKTVLKYVLRPLVEKEGMAAAVMDDAGKLELVQQALKGKGAEIGELTQGAAGATVDLQEDLLDPILKRIKASKGKVLAGDQVNALEELKADVVRLLGKEHEVMPPEIPVKRTNAELTELLQTNPQAMAEVQQTGKLTSPQFLFKNIREPIPEQALAAVKVPVGDAIAQRRALQDRVFKDTQQLDPKARVELLREISHDWNEAIYKRLDEFSHEAGEDTGQKLRALNKEYQQLSVAKDVLDYNTGRFAANNTFSLGDQLWGAAHFAGALAAGHPFTAVGAIGTSMAHKFLRQHGNAYGSLMLDRLSTWGGVSRATAEIDEQVDRAIDNVMSASPYRRRARVFQVQTGQSDDAKFEEARSRVRQLAAVAPGVLAGHLQERSAPVTTHAPAVSAAMQATATRATQFLTAALPPEQMPSSLTPQLEQPSATPAQKLHLIRSDEAVKGGPDAILKRLGDGTLTAEDVAFMKQVMPQAYAEISGKLRRKWMGQTRAPNFQTRLSVSRFIGQTTDRSQEWSVMQAVQRAYATHPQRAALPRSSAPRLSAAKNLMGPFDTAQYGSSR